MEYNEKKEFIKHEGDEIGIKAFSIICIGIILIAINWIFGLIIFFVGVIYLFGNVKKIRNFNDFKKTNDYIEYSKLKTESQYKTTIIQNKSVTAKQRIKENKKNAVACCPKCGSTSLSANKKGYGIVKGGLGALGLGSVTGGLGTIMGLGVGNLGAKKVLVTCLNCGKRFKPGK